jgi:sugar lactone lactonase YvrE/enterochelin esterase-like enzyme
MRRSVVLLLVAPLWLAALLGRAGAADDYQLGPDSLPRPGVPRGTLTQHSFAASKVYPGTTRDYWVYVPAQYDAARPPCLMVFQDGAGAVKPDGNWRVPTVFDNLIAAREMPVTIGLFVTPGVVPPVRPGALPRFNRSVEYDGLGGRYARFLLEELIPEVEKSYRLSPDPGCRAIGGASSGAIAAFTAAWERPDAFGRVYSAIGTYVGQRGGDRYPVLVRKSEPRPLRIFLQDGSNDQNIYGGNWWIANQSMLSALEYAGYEVAHEWGDGGHTHKHGGSILPAALRWLWRDFGKPITAGVGSKQPVMEVLIPGEGWQVAGQGYGLAAGAAAVPGGELYFADSKANRIHKLGLDGKVGLFASNTRGAASLAFGPGERLLACQGGPTKNQRVVAYDRAGKESALAEGIAAGGLAVTHEGNVYATDPQRKQVWLVNAGGKRGKRVVDTGIGSPSGVVLTPDQSLLAVADSGGRFVYSFQIQADGSLAHRQEFCHLHLPDDDQGSGASGMAVDTLGRLYVATRLGVQICDQAGRVIGIVSLPDRRWQGAMNVAFAGPALDQLVVTAGDKLFRRKTRATGVLSSQAPVTPPRPKL